MIFYDDGTSLDSFKSSNRMVIPAVRTTIMTGQPQIYILPGELDLLASYNVAMKMLARSLIMKLRQIEAEGKCFAALAEHHDYAKFKIPKHLFHTILLGLTNIQVNIVFVFVC